jgi:hypothetical protein
LAVDLSSAGVPWAAQCFSTVTKLRVFIQGTEDESVLVPISTMSQLRVLEITGNTQEIGSAIPARAFTVLSSLSRLTRLHVGGSFTPCYQLTIQQLEVAGEAFYPGHRFTQADAEDMFSGLSSLEYLCLDAGGEWFPDYLLESISRLCPSLRTIHFYNHLTLQQLVGPRPPLFMAVTEMRIEDVESNGLSPSEAMRILQDVAPTLQILVCTCWRSQEKHHGCFATRINAEMNESRDVEQSLIGHMIWDGHYDELTTQPHVRKR